MLLVRFYSIYSQIDPIYLGLTAYLEAVYSHLTRLVHLKSEISKIKSPKKQKFYTKWLYSVCSNTEETGDQEKFPLAVGRGGKKVDIYRFGILMLSFALGEIIHDPVTIPKGNR